MMALLEDSVHVRNKLLVSFTDILQVDYIW